MKIKNIDGGVDAGCKCESWLDHWDRFSDQAPTYCPVENCMNQIEIGTLIQKDNPVDSGWYIVPLCRKHQSMRGETLQVNNNVKLVSAKVSETCG